MGLTINDRQDLARGLAEAATKARALAQRLIAVSELVERGTVQGTTDSSVRSSEDPCGISDDSPAGGQATGHEPAPRAS